MTVLRIHNFNIMNSCSCLERGFEVRDVVRTKMTPYFGGKYMYVVYCNVIKTAFFFHELSLGPKSLHNVEKVNKTKLTDFLLVLGSCMLKACCP